MNLALPPQVSLLGEPPKDFRIPLNPYLNLHSLLPASNLAGKEARVGEALGEAAQLRAPASPPAPRRRWWRWQQQQSLPAWVPLAQPPLQRPHLTPANQGCPTAMASNTPCKYMRPPSGGSPPKGPCVPRARHSPVRTSNTDCWAGLSAWETGGNMPDVVPAPKSCLFVSAHHQTLLPVSQSFSSPKRPVATRLLLRNR